MFQGAAPTNTKCTREYFPTELRVRAGRKQMEAWLKSPTVLPEKALVRDKHQRLFGAGPGAQLQPGGGHHGFQGRDDSLFWGTDCSDGRTSTLWEGVPC